MQRGGNTNTHTRDASDSGRCPAATTTATEKRLIATTKNKKRVEGGGAPRAPPLVARSPGALGPHRAGPLRDEVATSSGDRVSRENRGSAERPVVGGHVAVGPAGARAAQQQLMRRTFAARALRCMTRLAPRTRAPAHAASGYPGEGRRPRSHAAPPGAYSSASFAAPGRTSWSLASAQSKTARSRRAATLSGRQAEEKRCRPPCAPAPAGDEWP
ncbi:hypothetical protein JKP88DRAFT_215490 [Tribonema minus]|uniref:Uncharacterized protein n=1 Tax=Tribonema minus TaxID=303371 RepID=A0A835YRI0_9STRA|nr:hypothetical protein JKP88DRAFT_215490 [Tribonema minus]